MENPGKDDLVKVLPEDLVDEEDREDIEETSKDDKEAGKEE